MACGVCGKELDRNESIQRREQGNKVVKVSHFVPGGRAGLLAEPANMLRCGLWHAQRDSGWGMSQSRQEEVKNVLICSQGFASDPGVRAGLLAEPANMLRRGLRRSEACSNKVSERDDCIQS